MTRIDFYLLEDKDINAMYRFACKLAAQVISAGNQVYMHTENERDAKLIDSMLWEYPPKRFIPHEITSTESKSPITIGWGESTIVADILINLTDGVLDYFGQFSRLAEIVIKPNRENGRERYKFYRDRGFPLSHHKIEGWEN